MGGGLSCGHVPTACPVWGPEPPDYPLEPELRCVGHRWAIAPQYIEQFIIVLSLFKVSAPTIQHDCPSMVWALWAPGGCPGTSTCVECAMGGFLLRPQWRLCFHRPLVSTWHAQCVTTHSCSLVQGEHGECVWFGKRAGFGPMSSPSHRWAIAPKYIKQFRIVLSVFKVSAPTNLRDCSSLVAAPNIVPPACSCWIWGENCFGDLGLGLVQCLMWYKVP